MVYSNSLRGASIQATHRRLVDAEKACRATKNEAFAVSGDALHAYMGWLMAPRGMHEVGAAAIECASEAQKKAAFSESDHVLFQPRVIHEMLLIFQLR
jgi:hypothetical protein